MSTERPPSTPHRLRRRTAALAALVVSSATLSLIPATPAGAQPAGPADPAPTAAVETVETVETVNGQDAARQVAARRAAQHRLRTEVGRARLDAFLAQVAAEAEAARVAPVLAEADAKLGRPYVYGAGGPNAFDCSGFTSWAWKAAGVSLPHYTGAQWAQSQRIGIDELQPGDLVFYWEGGQRGDPSHVGLYVGDGQMIHAPGTGRSVRYESIWYWSGATVAAGRVA